MTASTSGNSFIVAVADLAGGAVIATVDTADLASLVAHASSVVIANIAG